MRRHTFQRGVGGSALALAALLLAAPAGAGTITAGQILNTQAFRDYVIGLPTATTPLSGLDRLPVLQNGTVRAVPGTSLSGALNVPDCPDTGGQHLNFVNGAFLCGGGSGGVVSVLWDDGTTLLWDDGTTLAGL